MTKPNRRKAPFTAHQVEVTLKRIDQEWTTDDPFVRAMLKDYALCLRRDEEARLLQEL